MLTQLVARDAVHPLDVSGTHRLMQAIKFDAAAHRTEVIEALNQPEEYPPYYWKYREELMQTSACLTQFALNDFMALG